MTEQNEFKHEEEKDLAACRRDWRSILFTIQRHRKFQLIITFGTISCAMLAYIIPHHAELIIIGSTITNMIWIWE